MATLFSFPRLFNFAANSCFKSISHTSICKNLNPALRLCHKPAPSPRLPWLLPPPEYRIKELEYDKNLEAKVPDVIKEINRQIATQETGRLFAVIHLCGKQFKITENDIIIVEGYWPPNPGDQLKLEKVMLLGSKDFTLIGRPVLDRELVCINATVIDKTLSHTKIHFRYKRRKQYKRIHFYRMQQTMLRINTITLNGAIDTKKDVEGLDRVY